jgi:hypothetical protein
MDGIESVPPKLEVRQAGGTDPKHQWQESTEVKSPATFRNNQPLLGTTWQSGEKSGDRPKLFIQISFHHNKVSHHESELG